MSLLAKIAIYLTLNVLLICGAQAQTGQGILCDTEAQARALADAGGGTEGVTIVNASSPHACAWVLVRYDDPKIVGSAMQGNRQVFIVQITVTHYFAGAWYELSPSAQYALVNLGEGA
jgi:hypothetical protein